MASERDEEEEKVKVEWRETRCRHIIGYRGNGPVSSYRMQRVCVCESVCVCLCHLWRNQAQPSAGSKGPINSLSCHLSSPLTSPSALTVVRRAHIPSDPKAAHARARARALSLPPCLPLPRPLRLSGRVCGLRAGHKIGLGTRKETDRVQQRQQLQPFNFPLPAAKAGQMAKRRVGV